MASGVLFGMFASQPQIMQQVGSKAHRFSMTQQTLVDALWAPMRRQQEFSQHHHCPWTWGEKSSLAMGYIHVYIIIYIHYLPFWLQHYTSLCMGVAPWQVVMGKTCQNFRLSRQLLLIGFGKGPKTCFKMIPSRELAYPTLGKGKSSANMPWVVIC